MELSCSRGHISPLTFRGVIPDPNEEDGITFNDGRPIPSDYCGDPDEFSPTDNC